MHVPATMGGNQLPQRAQPSAEREVTSFEKIEQLFSPLHERQANVISRLIALRNRLVPQPPPPNDSKAQTVTAVPGGALDRMELGLKEANEQIGYVQEILNQIEGFI